MNDVARPLATEIAQLTDPGRDPTKQVNEDSCTFTDAGVGRVALVCDGMGGHVGGRDASQLAQRIIIQTLSGAPADADVPAMLGHAIEAAARDVHALGGSSPSDSRPGSTCVVAVINAQGAFIAHVGDSRAYLIRGPRITRLTVDHSVVAELVARGVLDPAAAADHPEANQITRALGPDPTVVPDVRAQPVRLAQDDLLLLCSDGLTDLISDSELATITEAQINLGLATGLQALVSLANERGGHDNITAVLVRVLEPSGVGGLDAFQQVTAPGEPASPKTLALDAPPPVTERAPRAGHTEIMEPPPATERAPVPTVVSEGPGPSLLARGPVHVARPVRRSRRMLWIAVLVTAACLLIAVLVWAIRTRRSHTEEDAPPPPPAPTEEPQASPKEGTPPSKPAASETELVIEDTPEEPPEPPPSAKPTPSAGP